MGGGEVGWGGPPKGRQQLSLTECRDSINFSYSKEHRERKMVNEEAWNKSMYFFDTSKEKKYRNITHKSEVLAGVTNVTVEIGERIHFAELPKKLSHPSYPAYDIHVSSKKKDKNNPSRIFLTYFGATYSPARLSVSFGLTREQVVELASKLLETAKNLEDWEK